MQHSMILMLVFTPFYVLWKWPKPYEGAFGSRSRTVAELWVEFPCMHWSSKMAQCFRNKLLLLCQLLQGSYRSWKTWKIMKFFFSFPGLESRGIFFFSFPGLESYGILGRVMESHGKLNHHEKIWFNLYCVLWQTKISLNVFYWITNN